MQTRTSPLGQRIGRIVREARHEQGLTQEEVAFAAGVTPRTLHSIEHGASGVRLDTLMQVLSVLGMTIDVTTLSANRFTLDPDPAEERPR